MWHVMYCIYKNIIDLIYERILYIFYVFQCYWFDNAEFCDENNKI